LNKIDKAISLHDEINRKQKKINRLQDDLKRSLALQKLWPEAFEHGAAKACWTGQPMSKVEAVLTCRANGLPEGEWKISPLFLNDAVLTITNGKGDARSFSIDQVPQVLRITELRVKK
jgi:hypothetical protein